MTPRKKVPRVQNAAISRYWLGNAAMGSAKNKLRNLACSFACNRDRFSCQKPFPRPFLRGSMLNRPEPAPLPRIEFLPVSELRYLSRLDSNEETSLADTANIRGLRKVIHCGSGDNSIRWLAQACQQVLALEQNEDPSYFTVTHVATQVKIVSTVF